MPGSRRWWAGVALYVGVLFGVQPWLGLAVDAAKSRFGERAFAATVTAVAAIGAAALLAGAVPLLRRATRGELAMVVAAVLLYAAGVAALPIPQERLHYLEYGALSAVIYVGLGARRDKDRRDGRAALLAVLATAALGWLDEILQGALWERRYFDWRDVELNARAAVLGVLAAAPLLRAWRRGHAS